MDCRLRGMSIPRIRTRENHSFYLFIYLFIPRPFPSLPVREGILTRGLQYRRARFPATVMVEAAATAVAVVVAVGWYVDVG